MISVQNLGFCFAAANRSDPHCLRRSPALRNINLRVEDGEFVVITGPSGCGKSTLALAIGGFLFQQYDGEAEGRVLVASAAPPCDSHPLDVMHTPLYEVADIVGLVQQNPETQFCTLTVRDEVAFGLENRCLPRETIHARMQWALDIVGATHLENRELATLSGGEKQKIAIAAMMAAQPKILIFDEPTSNLDPTATAEIFDVIAHIRAASPITVIVIEHKLDDLRRLGLGSDSGLGSVSGLGSDSGLRLVAMAKGQIVYDGPMSGYRSATSFNGALPFLDYTPKDEGHDDQDVRASVGHFVRSSSDFTQREEGTAVRAEHLDVGYDGVPVVRDVSLEIERGEFVAIMGDNGSGKTTFLHTLLGLRQPIRGRVEVLGRDARVTPTSQLARQVGFVFQNPDHQLFASSVWEEATFAPRNFARNPGDLDAHMCAEAERLLAQSGLGDRRDDHPYRLSYGEKRRLNVVSVLTYNPPLILLDEVLIGQDAKNANFLMGLLREHVEQGGTVLMVNHAPEITQRYASRLIFFERGQIIVDAPTQDAFARLAALERQAYLPTAYARQVEPCATYPAHTLLSSPFQILEKRPKGEIA